MVQITAKQLKQFQEMAIIKSAIYSARLAGNPYTVNRWLKEHQPLRRQEILNIIADHPNCSFDFLQRRFSSVNSKTLHYDIKKLIDLNLISKIGATRGALYRIST